MNQSTISKWVIIIGLLLSASLIVAFVALRDRPLGEKYKLAQEYGGEFTLNNAASAVSLSDFKGKVVVIYFGFLSCTEACPASMQVISTTFSRLSKDELDKVQALFVSVDPKRDTLEELSQFSNYYNNKVIGLTADEATIKAVTRQYGVFFDLIDLDESALDYTVDHSSRFYMVSKQGKLITTMSHSTTPNELKARIQELLGTENEQ